MTIQEYKQKSQSELDLVLLDVRQSEERKGGQFIEGSLHIPMQEIITSEDIELPKDTHLVIMCQQGGRAEIVVSYLKTKGFQNIEKLEGGYAEYKKSIKK